MGYILKDDFSAIATTEDIAIISDASDRILEQCNKIACDEAKGYLSGKYNIDKIFANPRLFDADSIYNINDRIYTINSATTEVTHYECIMSGMTAGTGNTITDTFYYVENDSRDSKLLEVVMSMSLFYIHKRLSPNNIPTHRFLSYDGNGNEKIMSAIKWLMMIQSGSIQPYGWLLKADDEDIKDPEYSEPIDLLGNDPSVGLMWGNEISAGFNKYYYYYNEIPDANLINKETIKTDEPI